MTHAEIIAEARDKYTVHGCNQCEYRKSCDLNANGFDSDKCREMRQSIMLGFGIEDGYFTKLLDSLEAAHKREIDVLKQRCAELNAEVAAKDEVIKRLNDAIAEEQRRKMATAEKTSEVGNAAKLREAALRQKELLQTIYSRGSVDRRELCAGMGLIDAALAAPPRNCDIYLTEEAVDAATMTVRDCKACSRIDMEAPCVFCMVRWLLAPAKEGGAK